MRGYARNRPEIKGNFISWLLTLMVLSVCEQIEVSGNPLPPIFSRTFHFWSDWIKPLEGTWIVVGLCVFLTLLVPNFVILWFRNLVFFLGFQPENPLFKVPLHTVHCPNQLVLLGNPFVLQSQCVKSRLAVIIRSLQPLITALILVLWFYSHHFV